MGTRQILLTAVILALALSCRGRDGEPSVDPYRTRAEEITLVAREEFALTNRQAECLTSSLCKLFSESEAGSEEEADEARLAEKRNLAHRSFLEEIEKGFSREKAKEILAWYYNYSQDTVNIIEK